MLPAHRNPGQIEHVDTRILEYISALIQMNVNIELDMINMQLA